jgi:hypothetical protein
LETQPDVRQVKNVRLVVDVSFSRENATSPMTDPETEGLKKAALQEKLQIESGKKS